MRTRSVAQKSRGLGQRLRIPKVEKKAKQIFLGKNWKQFPSSQIT